MKWEKIFRQKARTKILTEFSLLDVAVLANLLWGISMILIRLGVCVVRLGVSNKKVRLFAPLLQKRLGGGFQIL
jgi:hypothetical protein